jgi:hypothetical protein
MEDTNLVELWIKRDNIRLVAGFLAGVFAAACAAIVGGIIASAHGMEFFFPVKLLGTVLLGPDATEYSYAPGLGAGLAVLGFICVFWGVIYAHFTKTNALSALLPMGVVWGLFSWIFIWNLFLPSFNTIKAAGISAGPALAVCLAYGIGLASVSMFDRLMR